MSAIRKTRSDATIPSLPAETKDELERWLFDENVSYVAAIKRAADELNLKLSRENVRQFYHERRRQRNLNQLAQCASEAGNVIKILEKSPANTFNAMTKLLGQFAFDRAIAASAVQDEVDKDACAGRKPRSEAKGRDKAMQQFREAIEVLLPLRKDDREEQRTMLEREKWEFDVVRIVQAHHTELNAILNNETLDDDARLQAIRQRIFGKAPLEES